MLQATWKCPKCNHFEFEADTIATTGTGLSRFFDIQNKKYTAITCKKCKFTEFYKADSSTLKNVLDFFVG